MTSDPFSEAQVLIAAERRRQIDVEGYSFGHDDEQGDEQLYDAACCYFESASITTAVNIPVDWPWAAEDWKPRNRKADLIRAGALCLAELERIDRGPVSSRYRGTVEWTLARCIGALDEALAHERAGRTP